MNEYSQRYRCVIFPLSGILNYLKDAIHYLSFKE